MIARCGARGKGAGQRWAWVGQGMYVLVILCVCVQSGGMLNQIPLSIDAIRVPVKRMKTLEPEKVQALAEDILENGQKVPIRVRNATTGYVLIEGLHRLEAMKALGEEMISSFVVKARLH